MNYRLKFLVLATFLFAAALFSACGEDSGNNSSKPNQESPGAANLELADGKIVACDDDMEGVVAITADDGYRKCVDGEWEKIKENDALNSDKIMGQLEDDVTSSSSEDSTAQSSSSTETSSDKNQSSSSTGISSEENPSSSSKDDSSEISSSSAISSSSSEKNGVIPESSSQSISAKVMPAGYYREHCPAGYECKDATSSEYLNPSVNYGEFLDTRDSQVYKTVVICNEEDGTNCQTWMAENLNYAYRGVKFRYVSKLENYTLDSTSWCYDDDPNNCAIYGRLYSWTAAMDSAGIADSTKSGKRCGTGVFCKAASENSTAVVRGVCPEGWHLPRSAEWNVLFENIGGISVAGLKLKSTSDLWRMEDPGVDKHGFSILPAGSHEHERDFVDAGLYAYFWSSTEHMESSVGAQTKMFFYFSKVVALFNRSKSFGYSVRCLKDSL